MKRSILAFTGLFALGILVAPAVWAADTAEPAVRTAFEGLEAAPDHIYLIANSSLIVGPDPNGRSEEITFVGPVTSPKWPLEGFERRTLEDGRQQIDIELTESELIGESYLIGHVTLGEHPDLRSLGTITQRAPGDQRPYLAKDLSGSDLAATKRPARSQQASVERASDTRRAAKAPDNTQVRRFTVTRAMARAIELNPEINWEGRIVQGLEELLDVAAEVQSKVMQPVVLPPVSAGQAEVSVRVPAEVAAMLDGGASVDWDGWVYQILQTEVDELVEANQIVRPVERYEAAVIPNDFMVKRKVLITTAKGILYNEAPVPVRGTIDSIPPVRRPNTPLGMNVFLGMELPVPLLNAEGQVDGWFYSKAHMAYAVEPSAIQRETARAKVQVRVGDAKETVVLTGPIEVHHNGTVEDEGASRTAVEVIVLALRGRSELLGGEVMMVEAFSDRDRFSRGDYVWRGGKPATASLDLFFQLYTPSNKLANVEPLGLEGSVRAISESGRLEKGKLVIPFVQAASGSSFEWQGVRPLVDEAGRELAAVEGLHLELVKPEPDKAGEQKVASTR